MSILAFCSTHSLVFFHYMHKSSIASTGLRIAVFMVGLLVRNTCLNCSSLRQLGHLVTVSGPLTATSSSCRQLNFLHGRRSFTASGPIVWSSLPEYLRDPTLSTDPFRRYLKTYFFCSILKYTRRLSALETLLTACAIQVFFIVIEIVHGFLYNSI